MKALILMKLSIGIACGKPRREWSLDAICGALSVECRRTFRALVACLVWSACDETGVGYRLTQGLIVPGYFHGLEGEIMHHLPEDDMTIARATLFLLEASAKAPYTKVHYRFGASEFAGTQDAAIEHLVKFPKPAHCTGAVSGVTLEITCTRADPDSKWRDVERVLGGITTHLSPGVEPEDAKLLLQRGSKSMLFPLRYLRRWFADYRLQDYAMSMPPNDTESLGRDDIVVVNIGPAPRIIREEIR
jgi:hypothetical protein